MLGDFFKDVAANVGGTIFDALRSLCYWLDSIIYNVIIYVYNWFLMLCNGRLLDIDVVKGITDRFSILLAIIMFFVVSVSILRMILDPDKITDKEAGMSSIIKKVLMVVVMLGLSTTVFDLLYDVQSILLGNNKSGTNVIQNFFSPYRINSGDFGAVLAVNMFTSFYTVDPIFELDTDQDVSDCRTYSTVLRNAIMTQYDFDFGYACLNAKKDNVLIPNSGGETTTKYVMKFESVLSIIAGCFVVYMLIGYCVKVGVRMVQLAFLEILSPMAIISYLQPSKDTMFNKWLKIYISTYIDVFIRIAIINLVVYLISVLMVGWNFSISSSDANIAGVGTFWSSLNISNPTTKMFMGVIMIFALLTFAQRAPELLKEILPKGGPGSIGFGIGSKDNPLGMGLLSRGAGFLSGAIGGAVGGAVGGGVIGMLGGAFRGGFGGLGNKKIGDTWKTTTSAFGNQKGVAATARQRMLEGGSMFVMPGTKAKADALDRAKADLDRTKSATTSYSSLLDKTKDAASRDWKKGTRAVLDENGNDLAANALALKSRLDVAKGTSITRDNVNYDEVAEYVYNQGGNQQDIDNEYNRRLEEAENKYNEQRTALAAEISSLETEYQAAEKATTKQFISNVMNGSITDAYEVSGDISLLEQVSDFNSGFGATLVGDDGSDLSGYDRLDAINSAAQGLANTTEQSLYELENNEDNRRIRTNAKYSGKK